MIEKVISGGQTGADQAGWRAARDAGIATGGWMPQGFLTEEGLRPVFAGRYGAQEHESADYPPRTRTNIEEADFTLIFVQGHAGRGTQLTINTCRQLNKPFIVVIRGSSMIESKPTTIARALALRQVRVLNVAGGRESGCPGIGAWAESFLSEVFHLLKTSKAEHP